MMQLFYMEYKTGSQNAFPNSNICVKLLNVNRLKKTFVKYNFEQNFLFLPNLLDFIEETTAFHQ